MKDNEYFDTINNNRKAYWLGFLWADGYCWIRQRNRHNEYGLKLDLSSVDKKHLEKFSKDIGIYTPIKTYEKYKNAFSSCNSVCRASIYNKHLVLTLQEKYGLIPRRKDPSKMLNNMPEDFQKDFIRGLLDADGSFTAYKTRDEKYEYNKFNITFGGNEKLLRYIEDVFIKNKLIPEYKRKLSKRHPDRDGEFYELKLSGGRTFISVLSWLYDNSDIYLDRKKEKFEKLKKERYNEDC